MQTGKRANKQLCTSTMFFRQKFVQHRTLQLCNAMPNRAEKNKHEYIHNHAMLDIAIQCKHTNQCNSPIKTHM